MGTPAPIIGQILPFKEGENWKDYTEILDHFFTANGITDEKKKVSILCSSVGTGTYHLIKTLCLPKKPEENTFEEISSLVENHFKPKLSEASASMIFYSRNRQKGETVQIYLASLRSLAKPCNFGQFLDRALRDKFIVGVNDEHIQEKILMVPDTDLTLEKAFSIAEAHEAAGRNVQKMRSDCPESDILKMDKKSQCFRCGNFHDPDTCYFKDKLCYKCQAKGHAKKMCKNTKTVKSDSAKYIGTLGKEVKSKKKPYVVDIQVQGQNIAFDVDTGSPVTIMSKKTFIEHFPSHKLSKSTMHLKSFSGHSVKIVGEMNAHVTYSKQNTHKDTNIIVTEHVHNIVGRDLIDDLNILSVNLLNHSIEFQAKVDQHAALFEDGVGHIKGHQAKVYVEGDPAPIFFKPRPLPYAMRSKVEKEIDRLESEGIIEQVKVSEWAAPVVPVLKASGQVRLCGDYKVTVNKVSKLVQYPIPTLEDLMAKLGKGSIFHKLDLSHAYLQVELNPESRKYVTINTHKGLYTYTRLPYGVSSAPAQFQGVMENLLGDIPCTVVYFDDILVTGPTESESWRNLDTVLSKLESSGAKLKREKCVFGAEEVEFLGHKVSKKGIKPLENKVQALVEAAAPTSVTQLKAYLGLLNYYGRFLQNLSSELHPLHVLLRKGQKWFWGHKQQKCFDNTKKMILSAKVLAHYDPIRPLILQVDSSQYGIGVVLSQTLEDGTEHPVAFGSRTLNDSEKKYSQLDKEGAAVIFGLKKFHKYLFGRNFTIVTDHLPLVSLFGEGKKVPEIASPRVQRWALTLSAYEYKIVFKPGRNHGNSDCFSRLPLPDTEEDAEDTDRVLLINDLQDCSFVSAKQIAAWTKRDKVLSSVHEYLLKGWSNNDRRPDLQPYKNRRQELSVHDGCILWGSRVVIPMKGRKLVMQELHSAHPGINKMKGLARSYVWWPGMDADLETLAKGCQTCQEHQNVPSSAPLHPWEYPDGPWKRLHIDFAGPIQGQMLFVVVDAYSKWIEVIVMNKITAKATILRLREIFARNGLCDVIVSDNGPTFMSAEFKSFMEVNGIVHVTTAPFSPSSNGLAERAVQSVKRGIEKIDGDCLHARLQKYLLGYRVTPHSTTGNSPSELLNNRKLKTLLDLLHPNLHGKVQMKQQEMKNRHDKHAKHREFHVGDLVSVRNYSRGPKWLPGVIIAAGPVFEVQLSRDGRVVRRHLNQMLPRIELQTNQKDERERREQSESELKSSLSRVVPPISQESLIQNDYFPVVQPDLGGRSEESVESSCSNFNESVVSDSMASSGIHDDPPLPVTPRRCSARQRDRPAYLKDYELYYVDLGQF